uniref:Uncharacterized protein n=1 Tax=Oryza sativa subsp. japonica TaxID=39947 RepID=Q6K2K3_ORYSJ|nr:hypothetical protein [Oryza sativa Japonica Group]
MVSHISHNATIQVTTSCGSHQPAFTIFFSPLTLLPSFPTVEHRAHRHPWPSSQAATAPTGGAKGLGARRRTTLLSPLPSPRKNGERRRTEVAEGSVADELRRRRARRRRTRWRRSSTVEELRGGQVAAAEGSTAEDSVAEELGGGRVVAVDLGRRRAAGQSSGGPSSSARAGTAPGGGGRRAGAQRRIWPSLPQAPTARCRRHRRHLPSRCSLLFIRHRHLPLIGDQEENAGGA